jgi:hypothetical protein
MTTRRRGERSRASALVCTLVVILCHQQPAHSFVPSPRAPIGQCSIPTKLRLRHPLPQENQPRKDEDDLVDAFRAEEEASQKVTRRLIMPRVIMKSISQTITAIGWSFLVVSFVLQALGYALVLDDSTGLRIDTLDAQNFQQEVNRSIREMNQ